MAASTNTAIFRLTALPAELILEIAVWAQILWREAELAAQTPYAGVKRYVAVSGPLEDLNTVPPCCDGTDYDRVRPRCLQACIPPSARSPAQCLSQTGRGLRYLLITGNSAIWKLDNVLFKQIAERSGVQRASVDDRSVVQYGARTLIATKSCSCLLRTLPFVYLGLESVKLALPWQRPDASTSTVEEFCIEISGQQSGLLRHFDLEVYSAHPLQAHPPRHRPLRAVKCEGLQTSRFSNASLFFFSTQLTSLHIYQPLPRRPLFTRKLSEALQACSDRLQHLTIDAGGGSFNGLSPVALPQLRYLRLVAPEDRGGDFLSFVSLPDTVDLHLEPVVDWRWGCNWTEVTSAPFEVPFWEFEDEAEETRRTSLWQYASALAAPAQTGGIFQHPSIFSVSENSLWCALNTAALDIRLDPSTTSVEQACRRFPEYVSIAFTGSVQDMRAMLGDHSRDAAGALPPVGKSTARRSLSARDGRILAQERRIHKSLPKSLYDTVCYVAATALTESTWGPFPGHPGVLHIIFPEPTWLPRFSLGWLHVLQPLQGILDITFLSHGRLPGGATFTENMEGRLDPAHLEALALYLNEPGEGHTYPCSKLETIRIQPDVATPDNDLPDLSELEQAFNTPDRLHTGAACVVFVVEGSQHR